MSLTFDARPIGLFDSGVGGLSILREVRRLMPAEQLIYVSDARYLPYGERDLAFVQQRATSITDTLLMQDIKALVIACNTATAAAADLLRERYALPIVGIEPAVKPAAAATRSGIIGILATAGTLSSQRYADLVQRHGRFARVINQPCPGLVECIESSAPDHPRLQALLRQYIEPLVAAGADTLVLGCTHYPLIVEDIRAVAGPDVRIVDPGLAVARRLRDVIGSAPAGEGSVRYLTTGDPAVQAALMSALMCEPVQVNAL